jgi:hypothetical protein
MPTTREDRRALILLVSLRVFDLVSPFASEDRNGEIIFLFALYWTFGAAMLELSPKKSLRLPSLILAVGSLSAALVAIYHPVRISLIINWTIMGLFFGYVSTVLFVHLGRPGKITSGRLYVSVSLYLLLGVFYFVVFNLLDTIQPGSFVYGGSRPTIESAAILICISVWQLSPRWGTETSFRQRPSRAFWQYWRP